ncbi:MAG: tRNA lysidine(34) synthetase TilS [Candidatus Korobacteraceae bacterium]
MRDQVLHYIRERNLLRAGDRVAVAVSGGADSVALLRVLLDLRAELGIVLTVAHFNHQLRAAESDGDEQFVAELARNLELPFLAGRADVSEHATTRKLSLEQAARDLRYRWLHQLAVQENLNAVATGHTLDDQAETVLMKFLRGAGTRGLGSIRPILMLEHVPVVRPMLETPRADVEYYLVSLNQPWREDHTNSDTRMTRNRVRHQLLPLLERDFNPNIRQLLSETADVALAEEDFWQPYVAALVSHWHQKVRGMRLQESAGAGAGFLSAGVAVQRRALMQFLEWHGIKADFHHIEEVRRCALGEAPSANLPRGWRANRDGDWLQLIPPASATDEPTADGGYEYVLPIPGRTLISEAGVTVQATIVHTEAAALESPGTLLRAAVVGSELTFRNWHAGDRFRPAHSASEEKLKRLFSKKRIPAEQRPLWPVALSGGQLVWVREFSVAHDFAWVPGDGDAVKIEILPAK